MPGTHQKSLHLARLFSVSHLYERGTQLAGPESDCVSFLLSPFLLGLPEEALLPLLLLPLRLSVI